MMETTEKFDTAFATFLAGNQKITNDYFAKNCQITWIKELSFPVFEVTKGKKYIRIARVDGQTSVHVFVNMQNGDVLMPAGWRGPAKHARGNIYDEHNGLKMMGPYGPAYLR